MWQSIISYKNLFLTNYTEQTFLDRIRENLRTCNEFVFSVSFIKKAGLVLLLKDIEAALSRGAKGKLITSTYQNFTDVRLHEYIVIRTLLSDPVSEEKMRSVLFEEIQNCTGDEEGRNKNRI